MKVAAIIAEYNPFHNGHMHHLTQTKELLSTDYTVCVMSGNFVQRGETAIINKWSRTEMALEAGIDLVIELPAVFCVQSAEHFAFAAVKILDSLGIVDYLSFGSEAGDLLNIKKISDILANEPIEYSLLLKNSLDKGLSYPSAREKALITLLDNSMNREIIKSIMSSSNNILAIEYLKSLNRLESTIQPITIKRIKSDYNSLTLDNEISSATAIRHHLKNNNAAIKALKTNMPEFAYSILKRELDLGRGPIFNNCFEKIILAEIRKSTPDSLKEFYDVNEGLENRIKKYADKSGNILELLDNIKTKRYTYTRIQRVLINILLGFHKKELNQFTQNGYCQYIRLLGFSKKSTHLIKVIRENSTLPLITKIPKKINMENELIHKMLQLEIRASDIFSLGYSKHEIRQAKSDLTQKPIMVN